MTSNHATVSVSIAVLVLALPCVPVCDAEEFHSEAFGYRLDLPEGWIQIPPEIFHKAMAAVINPSVQNSILLDAGFQLKSATQWFQYPYVLTQSLPYNALGAYPQIGEDQFPAYVRAMTGFDVNKGLENSATPEMAKLLKGARMESPQLDVAKRRYTWTANQDFPGIGAIRGEMVGYFGRDAVVQIGFYSRVSDWDQLANARQGIIDSFQFDPDKVYSVEQNTVRDFGGRLLVTSDANWKAQLNTPADSVPTFTEAKDVERGNHVYVLIFFVNAKPGEAGSADVTCDLELTRPDKTISFKQSAVCFKGKLEGPLYGVRLSAPVIDFVGEPNDPAGKWVVRVVLRDNVRSVEIPLETSFELKADNSSSASGRE